MNANIFVGFSLLLLSHCALSKPPSKLDAAIQASHTTPVLPAPKDLRPDKTPVPPGKVEFTWTVVSGAAKYEISVKPSKKDGPKGAVETVSKPKAVIKLPEGTFIWKVTAIDKEGRKGHKSALASVIVQKPPKE